jgi:PhzF family phenazine biosynthesis protein
MNRIWFFLADREMHDIHHWMRYAAFTDRTDGGNPAGIVLDASGMDAGRMQVIAAEIGDSETAFLVAAGPGRYRVRYFSPRIEVPFCGHATIAAAIALFHEEHQCAPIFETRVGEVPVAVEDGENGPVATLTSVIPRVEDASPQRVARVLDALRWRADQLDPSLPPRIASAGARHLVLAAANRARLADLDYDFEALEAIMREDELTTIDLVWRETQILFHARNPFPIGGVIEDPATGAAAAAFGGYLRALGLVRTPARIEIRQGDDMGRPSRLRVEIGEEGGIRVGGGAVRIADASRPQDDRFRIALADLPIEDAARS